MNTPGWGGSWTSVGVAFLVVVQVGDVGGAAALETEDSAPVGTDRDRSEPGTRPDVAQVIAAPAAQVHKREYTAELICSCMKTPEGFRNTILCNTMLNYHL